MGFTFIKLAEIMSYFALVSLCLLFFLTFVSSFDEWGAVVASSEIRLYNLSQASLKAGLLILNSSI